MLIIYLLEGDVFHGLHPCHHLRDQPPGLLNRFGWLGREGRGLGQHSSLPAGDSRLEVLAQASPCRPSRFVLNRQDDLLGLSFREPPQRSPDLDPVFGNELLPPGCGQGERSCDRVSCFLRKSTRVSAKSGGAGAVFSPEFYC